MVTLRMKQLQGIAMLSYSGMSYDDFMDSYDKKIVKLRNCFNNIKQLAY